MKACIRCGEPAPEQQTSCSHCGTAFPTLTRSSTQAPFVSVLFADVVGSTALGEQMGYETLEWALEQWLASMGEVVKGHGGRIEARGGDELKAVFGTHEDDAVRAVRAAAAMRTCHESLMEDLRRERELTFTFRTGIETGRAQTRTARDGTIGTGGDPVHLASRLEARAPPGEILLGDATYWLTRDVVEVERLDPLTLDGIRKPVDAYRLLRVLPHTARRSRGNRSPLVGRADERARVVAAFEDAVRTRTCRLVTVIGDAGVGKSRLAAETTRSLRGRATIAAGRCLPYGDALTWWPLIEALGMTGLLDRLDDADPASARARDLLRPDAAPLPPKEAHLALRDAIELLARRRPLVLVVDDLHSAERPLQDFLLHLADQLQNAPVLLLATARRELREQRPEWRDDRPHAAVLELAPLSDDEAEQLLAARVGPARLGPAAIAQLLEAAAGNPLFVEELIAWRAHDERASADGAPIHALPAIPPTIEALITARLSRLAREERTVLELAAVLGKQFSRRRVEALGQDELAAPVGVLLRGLVTQDLVRDAGTGGDLYRFRHQMLRDVAYAQTPRLRRAELHERCADSLEADPAEVPVMDELIGHHVGCAVRLRRELHQTKRATAALAARASVHLEAAGRRAFQRDDPQAASGFFERAAGFVPSDVAARGPLLTQLGAALYEAGRIDDAARILDEAVELVPGSTPKARAEVERELVRLAKETADVRAVNRVVDRLLALLEDDDEGRGRALYLRGQAAWFAGRASAADAAWREAASCASRAQDAHGLFMILGYRATALAIGPTPVPEAISACEEIRESLGQSPVAAVMVDNPLATLHAMCADFGSAERLARSAATTLDRLGSLGWVSHHGALVQLLADQPRLAEQTLRAGVERLSQVGDEAVLCTTYAMLAQALYAQGRLDEADTACRRAMHGPEDDVVTQAIWRGVRAKVRVRRGEHEQGEQDARDAVALLEPTDLLSHRGDAMLDLAEVLRLKSRKSEYHGAMKALEQYEQKGNLVGAARARRMLADAKEG